MSGCETCKRLACICEVLEDHPDPTCAFRRSTSCAVPVECDHGFDVCPKCDPCTCNAVRFDRHGIPVLTGGDRWAVTAVGLKTHVGSPDDDGDFRLRCRGELIDPDDLVETPTGPHDICQHCLALLVGPR